MYEIGPSSGSAKKTASSGWLIFDGLVYGWLLSHLMSASCISAGFFGSQSLPPRVSFVIESWYARKNDLAPIDSRYCWSSGGRWAKELMDDSMPTWARTRR